jgi:hypothetical protein
MQRVDFMSPGIQKFCKEKTGWPTFFYINDKLLFNKVRAIVVGSRLSSHMLGFFV